jgi:hypothetical protein
MFLYKLNMRHILTLYTLALGDYTSLTFYMNSGKE